jgi:hypothetical protein
MRGFGFEKRRDPEITIPYCFPYRHLSLIEIPPQGMMEYRQENALAFRFIAQDDF